VRVRREGMSEYLVILNAVYTTIIGVLLKIEHEQRKLMTEVIRLECEKEVRKECEEEMKRECEEEMRRKWEKIKDELIRDRKYWTEVDREDLEKKN